MLADHARNIKQWVSNTSRKILGDLLLLIYILPTLYLHTVHAYRLCLAVHLTAVTPIQEQVHLNS